MWLFLSFEHHEITKLRNHDSWNLGEFAITSCLIIVNIHLQLRGGSKTTDWYFYLRGGSFRLGGGGK
jgi:hypothetical protein